jgi:Phycobilisome protein
MLQITPWSHETAGDRLLKIWSQRYLPNPVYLSQLESTPSQTLVESSSLQNRQQTANQIKRYLFFDCELAALRTQTLFADEPNIVNLRDVKRLSEVVRQVYETVLDLYRQNHPPIPTLESTGLTSTLLKYQGSLSPRIDTVNQLSQQLNPVLTALQSQHLAAKDPRTIGSVTTQFHYSSEEILKRLSPAEQVLISPYFKFAEEQVCIPWQQLSKIAAQYPDSSPQLALVERFLSAGDAIATQVYQQMEQAYPHLQTRRGSLHSPRIKASSLRDMLMLQGYLALCILEESMASVENKLLPLCTMVFPKVVMNWEFIVQSIAWLLKAIGDRLTPAQAMLLQPYSEDFKRLFQSQVFLLA